MPWPAHLAWPRYRYRGQVRMHVYLRGKKAIQPELHMYHGSPTFIIFRN